ncbi:MAG: chemotaxis protein CheA [Rhodospirillaceae bacterium]
MDLAALKQLFFGECDDYLSSANERLDALDGGGDGGEALNGLFRAVHSIKGGARAFGIEDLAEFAHVFETFMDTLRKGSRGLDEETYGRLTLGFDMLAQLVGAARGEGAATLDWHGFLADLRQLEGVGGDAPDPFATAPADAPADAVADDEPASGDRRFLLRVVPAPHMFEAGADPLLLLRTIAELGAVTTTIDLSHLPSLAEIDIEVPYFRWTVELETGSDRAALQDILDYLDDVATVEVEEVTRVDESVEDGDGRAAQPPAAAAGTRAVATAAAPPAAAAGPAQAKPPAAPAKEDRRVPTVRVDVAKLERLGNMVGELVIAQAVLQRQAGEIAETERPGLFRAIKDMSQYIRDLQDIALAVRAQPLKVAFSRLIPVARELERATAKKIRLAMAGDDTEIDKTVVDRLAEPLTHLLRNSVDHGIETREVRLARGKPPEGTIVLSARQLGSQVFIAIEDDGAGINRTAVRNKALQRGLIEPGAELSDSEIDNLIFLPGFSTAEQVTEVSGRGVGMDVVRQTITDLGGQLVVESTPGEGCRFTLVLPLSLAIVDVLVAEVGRQRYLLPIGNIIESVQPLPGQLVEVPGRGRFLHLRGGMLPIIALSEEFGVPGAVADAARGILVIAELRRGQVAALQVDDVVGQEPVVVKSLERNYRKVPGVAAATILGDGRAALIVDYSSLSPAVGGRRRLRPPAR